MNWLFIIVVVLLILCTLNGYRRGFIKTSISMLFVIIAIILVSIVTPYISNFLQQKTPLYNYVKEKSMESFEVPENQTEEVKVTDQVSLIENLELPKSLKKLLIENNNKEVYQLLSASGFSDYIGSFLAKMAVNAAAFVVTLLLVLSFLWMSVFTLDIIANLPVIHGVNKIAGIFIGFLQGLVVVWIGFLVLTIFSNTDWGRSAFILINKNSLLAFLYNNNYLLTVISGLVGGI